MQNLLELSNLFLLALFFSAVVIGWILGRQHKSSSHRQQKATLGQDYFQGLNYLLNDDPGRATDSFVKILESHPDSIESQIALGNMFRHKGEVNRAIRLHQDVIAKPSISANQRASALLALAQDYMSAGLYDRAERLFLDLYQNHDNKSYTLGYLHTLYQRQRDWVKAISVAEKLNTEPDKNMHINIAYYYCELAEKVMSKNNYDLARYYVQCALKNDKNCARANMIAGRVAQSKAEYQDAIYAYQTILQQDPDYLPEILSELCACYEAIDNLNGYAAFLKQCLATYFNLNIALAFSEILLRKQGGKEAERFMMNQLRQRPSLRGLQKLLEHHIAAKGGKTKQDILILQDFISSLIKDKPAYDCRNCGYRYLTIHWQCPSCEHWGTVRPIKE